MNQKILAAVLISGMFLVSCSTSNKFHASTAEDKPLFSAINELNKRPGNVKAQADLKAFYENSTRHHEEMIDTYRSSNDPLRFDQWRGKLKPFKKIYPFLRATPASLSI